LKLKDIRMKHPMQAGVVQYVHGALVCLLTICCHWWNILLLSLSDQLKGHRSTVKLAGVFKFKNRDKISKQSMFHLFKGILVYYTSSLTQLYYLID